MATISVIVPVYNVEQYLHRCVDSILAQTFTDFELILVDDGSSDNSGAICDDYAEKDSRVRVFHQENKGQAAARNVALDWILKDSNSKYISFVDSDDWVHPKFLELLYQANELFGTNISQCLHSEVRELVAFSDVEEKACVISAEEQYISHYSAFIWDKLYNRSCFSAIRFPEGQIFEDVAIWYKILFAESHVALVENTLYYYFVRNDSTIHSDWTEVRFQQITAWENQIPFFMNVDSLNLKNCFEANYLRILEKQLKEIGESHRISKKQKLKWSNTLKKKQRDAIKRFGITIRSEWRFREHYKRIHPVYAMYYKASRGLVRRLSRKKRNP